LRWKGSEAAMFTVCPKCTLTLAVTAPDLRIGQGFVRCGRCSNVFNALLALSEEPDAASGIVQPALAQDSSPSLTAPKPEAPPAQPKPSPPPQARSTPPAPQPARSTPAPSPAPAPTASAARTESNLRESRETGTFETIVLEGDGILQTEEIVPEEAVDSQIAAVARQLAANQAAAERVEEMPPVEEPEPVAEGVPAEFLLAPAVRDWQHLLLHVAVIVLLVLGLAAQAIHHWRNQLVMQPLWSAPLTRMYRALGMPLTPNWDVHAYDVRQLGATADPNGGSTIHVHVSLANHAPHAQPAPILRLTLLDRFGKRVAARDLKPADYLMPSQAALLQAGQRIEAQIAVADPGPDATSFELDACLIGAGSQLRCANDMPTLPPLP
jgi:predicted Zn finger-like uncharacterized protein